MTQLYSHQLNDRLDPHRAILSLEISIEFLNLKRVNCLQLSLKGEQAPVTSKFVPTPRYSQPLLVGDWYVLIGEYYPLVLG